MALSNLPNSFAPYVLGTIYDNRNIFTEFNFFTDNDPTHGYVDYLSSTDSVANGLIENLSGGVARIKVDSTSIPDNAARGRKSVRLESNTVYNHGLFIADVAHMPSSACGTWPALWQVGSNWFRDGEVDIVEGVHEATTNLISLHTDGTEGVCTLIPNEQNGLVGSTQCDNAITSAGGCGVSSGPFGTPFNDRGGGVYAMEWLSSGIKVWYFGRDEIPADITSGNPNPSSWSAPVLQVGSNCDIDAHFRNMRIVIDTTFCGDWAGNTAVWQQTSCYRSNPVPSNTCIDYVKNHPEAYTDGYWDINSIKVYNQNATSELNPELEPSDESPNEGTPTEETPIEEPPIQQEPLEKEPSISDPFDGKPTTEPTSEQHPTQHRGGGSCPAYYSNHDESESRPHHSCHYCSDFHDSVDSQSDIVLEDDLEVNQAVGDAGILQANEGLNATKSALSYVQFETGSPETQYIQASPGLKNGVAKAMMSLILVSFIFMI